MSLIAVTGAKGSPGVSSVATLLAAVWPRPVLLADTDPSGPNLLLAQTATGGGALDPSRGLLSFAAAGGQATLELAEHTQATASGLRVLLGCRTPAQVLDLGQDRWAGWAGALAGWQGGDVVADLGRYQPQSPTGAVLATAAVVVVVTRGDAPGLGHTRVLLGALAEVLPAATPVGVVCLGAAREARDVLGKTSVIGALPDDARSVAALSSAPTRALDRSGLVHAGRALAASVATELTADQQISGWVPPPTAEVSVPSSREPVAFTAGAGE